ncbi:type 2 isopentenyl-diphosphate Delta-isomerase [Rhizobium sp. SSA_523]|uniref:type 2 isopentenyl-diphosphate Delta-isomerase n=1 Tax=Rhizobium sp. SSA_523 TaxID=2952477 RepID=UPI002091A696|nr:type 2 isopentenyl-diphosphate Delta-isomerase [Rhizobium sp. SSA_523]MCO5734754.1 type 2 isopentenyl-diphosphate Delta-isomerase [Rhizobium sp. SSA_523]WKC22993.1 type 2 isopentenyl-diphosphate Delta-isomerase [Rhizobium sp. SSA_523]
MLAERKKQHLDIILGDDSVGGHIATGFETIRFEHVALPEIDMSAIDLSTQFLGKRVELPFLVSSMTGGAEQALRINHNIAIACQGLGIPFAVGSQRIAIETEADWGMNLELRRLAPSVPILANIGAAQLNTGYGLDQARRAVEMIDADALIIHLNPLQEAVQPEGDRNWNGLTDKIGSLCQALSVPVVVKEVGSAISPTVADRLSVLGIGIIDVAGAGGTSWAAVEAQRARTPAEAAIAAAFSDWGQPTAYAIAALRQAKPDLFIIGSGGIRTGVDAAKAIRMGADLVGQAASVLRSATRSPEDVANHFEIMAAQLRVACFCTGSADLAELRHAKLEVVPFCG